MDWENSILHGERALALLKHIPDAHDEKLRVLSNLLQGIWGGDKKMAPQGFAHFVLGCVFEKAGNHTQALRAYQKADAIYDTVLQEKAIHDVGQLYRRIIKLARRLKKMDLARLYLKKQGHVFGLNHPRTKELMKVCDQFFTDRRT